MDKRGLRVNDEITAKNVRLVIDGSESAIVSIEDALRTAKEKSLDLVEISPNQDPPVVKLIDYSRFVFDQRKKSKEHKKKQKVIHLKEVRFRPVIASHDYEYRINQAKSFIDKGDKVKFSIRFKGREIIHNELGFKLLEKVLDDMKDCTQVEQPATTEGRAISMVVAPLAGSKRKKTVHNDEDETANTDN